MSYTKRTCGPRGYRHDPSTEGIFIHGGTCLMHGLRDNFRHQANPNHFTLTFPLMDDSKGKFFSSDFPAQPTFSAAVTLAESIRASHHELQACHIYACTDFIQEKSYCGRSQVQLVSPRISRKQSARIPHLKAA